MAMTNAEKVRAHRERKKAQQEHEQKLPQAFSMSEIFKSPFFEFAQEAFEDLDFEMLFDMMGLEAPRFENDDGPKSFTGDIEFSSDPDWRLFEKNARSLDRAEIMIAVLIDAAWALAKAVNQFKKREIDARIAEISPDEMADPESRKAAIKRIVYLTKLREQLEKEVRWQFPQWRVKTD